MIIIFQVKIITVDKKIRQLILSRIIWFSRRLYYNYVRACATLTSIVLVPGHQPFRQKGRASLDANRFTFPYLNIIARFTELVYSPRCRTGVPPQQQSYYTARTCNNYSFRTLTPPFILRVAICCFIHVDIYVCVCMCFINALQRTGEFPQRLLRTLFHACLPFNLSTFR